MKKLSITKEAFEKSNELKQKYGKLEYVSESGRYFKTSKGRILKFVTEAREYVDDDSIEVDSADEFILFDDPEIFTKIANVQKKEEKKVEDEIKDEDVTKKDVAQAASQGPGMGQQVASSAITTAISGAGSIITNPTVISMAAGAYGVNKAQQAVSDMVDAYKGLSRTQKWNAETEKLLQAQKGKFADQGINFDLMQKGQKYMWDMADTNPTMLDKYGDSPMHNMEFHKMVAQSLPEKQRSDYLKSAQNLCDKYGSGAVAGAASATAATAAGGAGAAGAAGTGTTIFGMSLATIGWIAAGVAAAAIITPYIYDKVRACTKTWLADIIAEIKFKADGKNYRCFYDLKENKWILTYADIKWGSYLDNKLDKETQEEFFQSQFFKSFLERCRKAFAMLFSTSRNEVVFKTLPEIKDAPKELKSILEKIYDNKGAITKNMFTGKH